MKDDEGNQGILRHRNSQTALKIDEDSIVVEMPKSYDYKGEAIKGNFMPSIIKLENLEVNINDIICLETGNTLLHLAVHYSLYNVVRTYIETFHADINTRNKTNQTPLHLNCGNPIKDIMIFTYLLNNPSINIEAEDQNGLRAIDYAVINNFNLAFLFLVAKGADLIKSDEMGNGLIYYALVNNNKFVTHFLYTHLPTYAINASFYDQQASLADVLITNKNTSISKFITKYYYEAIEVERIESCTKFISEFPFYNRFNYEVINTMLFYKQRNTRLFLNSLFPLLCCCLKQRKKGNSVNGGNGLNNSVNVSRTNRLDTSVNRQLYFNNKDNAVNRDICYDNRMYNLKRMIYYVILKRYKKIYPSIVLIYCITLLIVRLIITPIHMYDWYSISSLIITIALIMMSFIGFFFNWHSDSMFIKEKHSFKNSEHNVFNSLSQIIQKSQLGLFPSEETICEVCLTYKAKTTHHCRECNKCVIQFYYHSFMFNSCVNRKNVYLYLLFLLGMLLFHCSFCFTLWALFFSSSASSGNYFFTKVVIGIVHNNPLITFIQIYLIIFCSVIIGKVLTLLLCLGSNVPYYNMFRYHKRDLGEIVQRNRVYVGIPKMYVNTCKDITMNLIGLNKEN